VPGLGKTTAGLLHDRQKWQTLMRAAAKIGLKTSDFNQSSRRLREIHSFGSNPGALRMFTYLPAGLADQSALVVVLHGCAQTAASYEYGAGWSTLAERYGFALLLPEQQRANNPNGCFNWFQPGDTRRGQGEALSIRQMVDKMLLDHGIDGRRVYVTGLSAGGAMASVMLATYPDVFAGGAIIAGLPYGAATNVQNAFESMFQGPPRPAGEWGDLVRRASPHLGPWPRISVWHGGMDTTVVPSNAAEIVKQWTDVHGLPAAPTVRETVDGYPREVWRNAQGEDLMESYAIPGMAHGTPISVGTADDQCGATGAFLLEVGISSSYRIAKFWDLAQGPRTAKDNKSVTDTPRPPIVIDERPVRPSSSTGAPRSPAVDIRAVITQALRAAGLMKTD
jgi:poly(hydroxyalkanoate) depolymerase family esterase